MGLPSRSFAADAHDGIMVLDPDRSTEYKGVARCSAPDGELPSDHHQKPWLRRGPIGKKRPADMWTIGGADRLRFPRFPSKLEKRGKCSPSPTYPAAPPTRRIDHRKFKKPYAARRTHKPGPRQNS